MRSLHRLKQQRGFTIVELLIVIVVIGILAALVIVTFSGIQQRARNTERQTDINAIQGHLEAYYADEGAYPTLAMLTDDAFRAEHMKGLDPAALVAPGATGGAEIAAGASTTTQYQYEVWSDTVDNTACPAETGLSPNQVSVCQAYRLTAALEGDPDYVKQSN
jgi:general secretion pathway protein G